PGGDRLPQHRRRQGRQSTRPHDSARRRHRDRRAHDKPGGASGDGLSILCRATEGQRNGQLSRARVRPTGRMIEGLLVEGASIVEAVIIAAIVGAAIFGSYYMTWRLLLGVRWRRRPSLSVEPIPAQWSEIVERRVSLTSRVTQQERERLVGLGLCFLSEESSDGCA